MQPEDLTASEIDARLGAVWIPPGDVEAFAKSLLGNEGITVSHAAAVGTWFVRGDYDARATVANTTEWGTMRYSALELIQDALNLKTPTVYDADPKTESPRDQRAGNRSRARQDWRRSKSASRRGFGKTTSAASGSAGNTTTSSTASGCASSTAAI